MLENLGFCNLPSFCSQYGANREVRQNRKPMHVKETANFVFLVFATISIWSIQGTLFV